MGEQTVVEELTALRSRGYAGDFTVTDDSALRCEACGHVHPPEEAVIESTARFEGASDPDDEAVVYGLRCLVCGTRGVLVATYGPMATAEEAAVVTALSRRG